MNTNTLPCLTGVPLSHFTRPARVYLPVNDADTSAFNPNQSTSPRTPCESPTPTTPPTTPKYSLSYSDEVSLARALGLLVRSLHNVLLEGEGTRGGRREGGEAQKPSAYFPALEEYNSLLRTCFVSSALLNLINLNNPNFPSDFGNLIDPKYLDNVNYLNNSSKPSKPDCPKNSNNPNNANKLNKLTTRYHLIIPLLLITPEPLIAQLSLIIPISIHVSMERSPIRCSLTFRFTFTFTFACVSFNLSLYPPYSSLSFPSLLYRTHVKQRVSV